MRIISRGAAALALGSLILIVAMADASAASAYCRQLEAQLSGAGGGKSGSLLVRQRAELRKAQGQLRAANCGFFGSARQCQRIRSVIGQMERNIVRLESGRGAGRSRARILAALDANGCRERSPQQQMMVRRQPQGSFLSAFFGSPGRGPDGSRERYAVRSRDRSFFYGNESDEFRSRDAEERDGDAARRSVDEVYGGEARQAMCVRLSDGYYFPVSPSSSRANLRRDQNNCQAMCPGSEVDVYYKRLDDDETAQMISATSGRQYSNLPAAFRYRQQAPKGCSGDRAAAMLASNQSKALTMDFVFPVPSPKPGSDNTIPLWLGSVEAAVATAPPEERTVRVVGPAFLPDPPEAEVRPVPAPIPAL